jgi:hypothetical protein
MVGGGDGKLFLALEVVEERTFVTPAAAQSSSTVVAE